MGHYHYGTTFDDWIEPTYVARVESLECGVR